LYIKTSKPKQWFHLWLFLLVTLHPPENDTFWKVKCSFVCLLHFCSHDTWRISTRYHKKKMKKIFVNVLHRLMPCFLGFHFLKHSKKFPSVFGRDLICMNIPSLFKGYEAYSLRAARVLYKSYTSLSECPIPLPHISPMSKV